MREKLVYLLILLVSLPHSILYNRHKRLKYACFCAKFEEKHAAFVKNVAQNDTYFKKIFIFVPSFGEKDEDIEESD